MTMHNIPQNIDDIRRVVADLPTFDAISAAEIERRQNSLTKPAGSLGRLEELVSWLGGWQRRSRPVLERVEILVFAGNHGVTAQGVSPYPPEVTAQMLANFERGGACINQLAQLMDARLRVIPLFALLPTHDFTQGPAMVERDFLAAFTVGFSAVVPGIDLLALGEMGIGNTTAAAAITCGLYGGGGARWAGRGTGLDDAGVMRKSEVVDRAIARNQDACADPLMVARCLGGFELAAMMGAVVAARLHHVPVLLDGFVCTAAVAPLAQVASGALDHCRVSHRSAEAAHGALADRLGQKPLLDLDLRLGEASGAALAIGLARAGLACFDGMASFEQADVSNRA